MHLKRELKDAANRLTVNAAVVHASKKRIESPQYSLSSFHYFHLLFDMHLKRELKVGVFSPYTVNAISMHLKRELKASLGSLAAIRFFQSHASKKRIEREVSLTASRSLQPYMHLKRELKEL